MIVNCVLLSIEKVLQKEQEAEIARLEKEVVDVRHKHSEAVQKLKSKFLQEKRVFQEDSDAKIQDLTKEANMVRLIFFSNPAEATISKKKAPQLNIKKTPYKALS